MVTILVHWSSPFASTPSDVPLPVPLVASKLSADAALCVVPLILTQIDFLAISKSTSSPISTACVVFLIVKPISLSTKFAGN